MKFEDAQAIDDLAQVGFNLIVAVGFWRMRKERRAQAKKFLQDIRKGRI